MLEAFRNNNIIQWLKFATTALTENDFCILPQTAFMIRLSFGAHKRQ